MEERGRLLWDGVERDLSKKEQQQGEVFSAQGGQGTREQWLVSLDSGMK